VHRNITMNILLTGGTGYIGSHAAADLLAKGHNVILLDNFSNSNRDALSALNQMTSRDIIFIEGDILNSGLLAKLFRSYSINAVMHFAGLKSVVDSAINPIAYFKNNVQGTICLLEAMEKAGVYQMVFSSSATVYGHPKILPINECHSLGALNPYGLTKQHIEEILKSVASANASWQIINLRYFNPVGAHSSGMIGESISNMPNNIMPLICKVAIKELDQLNIYGKDYNTIDGTGVRDYIDIRDLIDGHISALEFICDPSNQSEEPEDGDLKNFKSFNLGTGRGYSVLELVHAFEKVSGVSIPYIFRDRRIGDIAECYADTQKAKRVLNWSSQRSLTDMCQSVWNFIK
jgi:UDP-glucose 4-epimerase